MDLFIKTINGSKKLNSFAKNSIRYVWQGAKYAPGQQMVYYWLYGFKEPISIHFLEHAKSFELIFMKIQAVC